MDKKYNNKHSGYTKFKNLVYVLCISFLPGILHATLLPVEISKSMKVGEGIVQFIPVGFDAKKTPSLAISHELEDKGSVPASWKLIPSFSIDGSKASASLTVPTGTSLYGGGEVTGPLLRNGKTITLWNTDSGAYGTDGGKRLYQSHPWVLGVRTDGTAFGIIFDSSWKAELTTNSDKIDFKSEGSLFRVLIIDRNSPQDVLRGLAELTGTMPMIPRWALGYQQCRFSYSPAERVIEIADTFRLKKIPCDVIWMDIDYMDGYKIFTFNPKTFPDPSALNRDLHLRGFHSAWMIDPGVKVDQSYSLYKDGTQKNVWVKTKSGSEYHGKAWPGACAFPDFTIPEVRSWWSSLYKDFMAKGVDGVWNDVNEPAINDEELGAAKTGTMPIDNYHRGGGDLPSGSHLLYHNAYARLMVQASREGIMAVNPDKRPFLLTRSNFLGGQKYSSTWTGDNLSCWDHLKLSIPMSLTLGLSGQPFSGSDIGGFLGNADADLWGNWIGLGAFYPFARGHACAGTNAKEPWAFGKEVEDAARIAIERRYRLLPYMYTLLHESSVEGLPMMRPVFFADTKDLSLRAEEQTFLLGENILVIPSWAIAPSLPKGVWEKVSIVNGDNGKFQAQLKIRGGSIVPCGKIIQNTNENSLDPLTLLICLDENGIASGSMYWDSGDGWNFECGEFRTEHFYAQKQGNTVLVTSADVEGKQKVSYKSVQVELITANGVIKGSGSLATGITIQL